MKRLYLRAAVTALVALTAWSASVGAQVHAPDGAVVSLRVAYRWGDARQGTWTPYIVTVSNHGEGDVEGMVRLVADPIPPPDPGAKGPATLPDGFPSYQARVSLAAGAQKALNFVVVEPPGGYRAELVDLSGGLVARADRAATSSGQATIAVLSDVAGAADLLNRLPNRPGPISILGVSNPVPVATVVGLGADNFPNQALQLSGLQAVVIDGFDTAQLSGRQLGALRDFVALGGDLVLGGGRTAPDDVAGLSDQLVPMAPKSAAICSLAPLDQLDGGMGGAFVSVSTGPLRHGQALLTNRDGMPLVVEASFGAGHVVQLAYDPLAERFRTDPALFAAGWDAAMTPLLVPVLQPGASQGALDDPMASPTEPAESSSPSWPDSITFVLLGYLVGAGAIGLVVARRHRAVGWLVVVVGAAGAALAVALTGRGFTPQPDITAVDVQTLSPAGAVVTVSERSIAPTLGSSVGAEPAAAVSTVLTNIAPISAIPAAQTASGLGGGTIVDTGGSKGLSVVGLAPAERHSIETVAIDHRRPALDTDIHYTLPPGGGPPRLVGRVINRGSSTMHQVHVQLPRGWQSFLATSLAPGQSIKVDTARLIWPDLGAPGHPSPAQAVFAAADRALANSGELAVVAEQGSDLVVSVVQPTGPYPLARPANVSSAQLLAASHQSDGTWLDAYRVPVPPDNHRMLWLDIPGGSRVRGKDYHIQTDIYNWTTGTWRSLPDAGASIRGDPHYIGPLDAGEVAGGSLLVRLWEPVPYGDQRAGSSAYPWQLQVTTITPSPSWSTG